MALHSGEYWDDMSGGDGRVALVDLSPLVEGLIMSDKESLLRGRRLGKRVAYVRSEDQHVLGSSDGVE